MIGSSTITDVLVCNDPLLEIDLSYAGVANGQVATIPANCDTAEFDSGIVFDVQVDPDL